MKKILVFSLLFFIFGGETKALEIVYPKKNPVEINADSTFFIGSAKRDEKLTINDIEVPVSGLGAFAQIVPLEVGKNEFKIISGKEVINFVIQRPKIHCASVQKTVLTEYPLVTFQIKKENAPLRITPVNCGINRMAHLNKGVILLVNGEKDDFYRVYLNSKLNAWIAKSDVEMAKPKKKAQKALIKCSKTKEDEVCGVYEFKLSKKVPFTVKEENGLTLQIFNIEAQPDCTYCLNIPAKKLIGYDAYYKNDKFILKIRKYPEVNAEKPLEGVKIAVDAGHGGKELGAIGCCGDKEKDINLAIAKELKNELQNRGAKVIMTRDRDVDVSLQDRVKIAKEKDAALLISIHANALPDGADPIKNRGTSVYYYHNQAKPLADSILNSITTQAGTKNDKAKQGSLALVRPTSSVSVLIEVAYIINPDDYALLLDKDFRSKCAKAIADGIENYLRN